MKCKRVLKIEISFVKFLCPQFPRLQESQIFQNSPKILANLHFSQKFLAVFVKFYIAHFLQDPCKNSAKFASLIRTFMMCFNCFLKKCRFLMYVILYAECS